MIENNVKIPQVIALILLGVALAASVLCVLSQQSMVSGMSSIQYSGPMIVPLQLYMIGICFLIQLIFLFIALKYEGRNRRVIAGIVAAVYCLINTSTGWLSVLSNMVIARQSQERLAAYGLVSSAISNSTSPFLVIASALFFIAIGRYGISKNPDEVDL